MNPYMFLVIGLFSFAAMGIIHKIGDRSSAQPLPIALYAVLTAGLLSGTRALLTGAMTGAGSPPRILLIAIPFGIATGLSLWLFQEGLRFGRIATSWLIINLSAGVPTVLSIFVYHEELGWKKTSALLLIVVSLLLLWWDRKTIGPAAGSLTSNATTEVL